MSRRHGSPPRTPGAAHGPTKHASPSGARPDPRAGTVATGRTDRPGIERAAMRNETTAHETIFGLRAGLAVHARRADDIVRVAFGKEVRREVDGLIRWAISRRIACDELRETDLARLAGTPHHEGLCVTARARAWATPSALADGLIARRGAALALDRVRNPYNVGAILRSAAFFGLDAVLLGAPAPHPALAPDAVRVAEGGAEHVTLARTTDLADTLARLRARGVRVVGTDGNAPQRALGYRFARPTVLVMGHEREGLSPRVRSQCDAVVSIAGSGAIESLNVGVAAGLLIAELMRTGSVDTD